MDSDEDQYIISDVDSDAFVPEPPKKAVPAASKAKAPAKAKASTTASKKSAPKQPLAPRRSNGGESEEEGDISVRFEEEEDASPKKKTPVKAKGGKSASQTYQKLSQLEHVLKRPDTYIGSVESHTETLWVYDSNKKQMAFRETTYVPGFYKIFDEILVNAADNKVRDETMDTLKVTIDKEEGSISVWNNGQGIPIEMHEKEKIYIPELIFGNLLTSSNYDDDEAKVTGGRNGYGAKLANIYSTEFTVETADKKSEQKYKQVFSNNMSVKGKPKITKNATKAEFTCITFKPDFKRFGMDRIDDGVESLLMKRVYDMAGTVKDIKVYLNGERLKVKNFKQYVEMYVSAINELSGEPKTDDDGDMSVAAPTKHPIIFESTEKNGKTWEVAFAVSDGSARQVSFVNNIATIKGGTHVTHVSEQIVDKLEEAIKKNKKNGPVKRETIRKQLWVFVNCQIVNPTFDGQTKETLTLKVSGFGSRWSCSDEFAKKVLKSGVLENVLSMARFQQEKQLKKTDGSKRSRVTGIPKLEDANNAGTKQGSGCTLILTEGDSAKALAVSGLTEVGRDNFGVFPLRGKLLNVREATHDMIMKNVEIQHIKAIMGLQQGKVYTSTDSLRYGSIMIMTDQDHDGSHIKGLIINYLDHFFPSLLKLPNFLVEFITPIVKVTKGKNELSFFTIPEYETWKEQNNEGKGWVIKYYKGLGTSDSQAAKKYFRAMNKHMLPFQTTQPGDRELIDMAFNKRKADDRKEWLRHFKPGTYLDHNIDKVPLADFINKELILFSMADNVRSIPSMVDGLKPGQRKVLFGCFKRKLKAEIKVAQLAGYVSEHSAYHHGEQSLTMTIVGLAQDFCGSNNVNILSPNGQFGTRGMGGKDAASARYIFTNLPKITRTIFNPADDNLLNYLNDDGQSIEPEWYMPTLPMILVNGSEGIGTGWSSNVPNYNPSDIVENLKRRAAGEEYVPMMPWYRGFTGEITRTAPDKFKVTGTVRQIDDKTFEITELPIRVWTSSYKEDLEARVVGTEKIPATLKEYKEYHTDTTVNFVVELNTKGQEELKAKGIDAFFKLSSSISTSNMMLFDTNGKIKKYSTPEEILDEFYIVRLNFYQKRKEYLVDELKLAYERLSNQARFVQMIITRQLSVSNRKRTDIVAELREKDFRPFPKQAKTKVAADVDNNEPAEEEEDTGADTDYDYLLSMAIYTLTKEKVDKLLKERDERETELNALLGRSVQSLWQEDLDAFLEEWEAVLAEDERRLKDVSKKTKTGKTSLKKAAKAGAAARRVIKKDLGSDEEEEMDFNDDDSEDDFEPAKKVATKAKGSPRGKALQAKGLTPAIDQAKSGTKRSSAGLDDDDLEMLVASKPVNGTTSSSRPARSPPPAKKKAVAKPESIDMDNEDEDDYMIPSKTSSSKKAAESDTERLAPIFRKAPAAAAGAKARTASGSSASGAAKRARAAAKKAPAKTKKVVDSEDDGLDMAPAPVARKAKAGRKVEKDESEDELMMNGAGVSSSPPVARAGRAARTAAARKPAYVEVDDEESEQASAFEGEESDED